MADESRQQEFRKHLKRGFGVSEAAAAAGLTEDEVDEAFEIEVKERSRDDVAMASVAHSRFMSVIDCLEELMQVEENGIRLGAANSLLKLAMQGMKTKIDVSVGKQKNEGLTLWDFTRPKDD